MLTIEQRLALAVRHHKAGRLREAETLYRGVLREVPRHAHALHLLGLLAQHLGRHHDAIELIRKALAEHGPQPVFHSNLAASYLAAGNFREAVAHCREAVRLDPNSPEPHNNLGIAFLSQGLLNDAEAAFRSAVKFGPAHVDARCNLAGILQRRGQHSEALTLLQEAVGIVSGHAPALNQLGWTLLALNRPEDAAVHLREAVRLRPGFSEALNNLGVALRDLDQGDEAIAYFRESLRLNPDSSAARHNLGHTLEALGKIPEAIVEFKESLRRTPNDSMTLTSLGRLASSGYYRFSEEQLHHIRDLVVRNDLPLEDRSRLHQVLCWVFDQDNDHEQAFAHCTRARELRKESDRRQGVLFDLAAHRRLIDCTIDGCSREWIERAADFGVCSELPVFIVGMMRSGTTLVEQILASHSQVFGAGELPDVGRLVKDMARMLGTAEEYPDCLPRLNAATARALAETYLARLRRLGGQASRVVDKMPFNYLRLGLLATLFPGARFIHCRRDPLDTCLSCYFQNFSGMHPFALDLRDLGCYYREYERLMTHWARVLPVPIFDLPYEELTADPEGVSRRLLDFCGLEWDERCLRFSETPRMVRTASVLQVRQPVYRSSVGKWKRYEKHLLPLIEALRTEG